MCVLFVPLCSSSLCPVVTGVVDSRNEGEAAQWFAGWAIKACLGCLPSPWGWGRGLLEAWRAALAFCSTPGWQNPGEGPARQYLVTFLSAKSWLVGLGELEWQAVTGAHFPPSPHPFSGSSAHHLFPSPHPPPCSSPFQLLHSYPSHNTLRRTPRPHHGLQLKSFPSCLYQPACPFLCSLPLAPGCATLAYLPMCS